MIIYSHLIKKIFQSVKKVDLKFDPDLIQNNNKNININTTKYIAKYAKYDTKARNTGIPGNRDLYG